MRNGLLSSCQPLEIPGNVIQACSLKNHSARNSPGQQRQLDSLWWEENIKACKKTNNKYHNRPPPSLCPLILHTAFLSLLDYLYPTSTSVWKRELSSQSDMLHLCHSRVTLIALSQPCVRCTVCAWFSSTPRLPVASYKNSFSMTEWRIRLEGSGQSSGTPFKDVCPFICAPCVEKKKKRLEIIVASAAKLQLNLIKKTARNFHFVWRNWYCIYKILFLITACQMISDTSHIS